MMKRKTEYNLSEDCVDAIADFVNNLLSEPNLAPGSYYEIQNLVSSLRLPFQMIDVCVDNCMTQIWICVSFVGSHDFRLQVGKLEYRASVCGICQ